VSGTDIVPMLPGDERPEMTQASLRRPRDYNNDLINVPAMWARTKGAGARVVVLDTGMPLHGDLSVMGARSFVEGYLEDAQGHATAVGSVLAGTGGKQGKGVTGVAPEADVWYGAVLNGSGAGSMSAVADGIKWAVDEVGADVVNLSLGVANAFGCDPSVEDACAYARECGTLLVAAAGNDASAVNWPAALDTVAAVAAVDRGLRPASFSARGPEVEFAAGGVSVVTAYKGGGYAVLSGTSFSAPVVSGIAALIVADMKSRGEEPSPDSVLDAIRGISVDVWDAGRDDRTGWGIPVFTKSGNVLKPAKPGLLGRIGNWLWRVIGWRL